MDRIVGESGLIAAFDQQAPPKLDLALGVLVRRAYPTARDFCEQIAAPEEDHDLRGHVRRTIIEGALRSLPPRFSGIVERAAPNFTGTQNHREIGFDAFVLTLSHTQHALAPLPDARFRDTLAWPQAGLFREFDGWESDENGNLYAVVVHGSPRPSDLAPSFLNIVFPLPGGNHGYGIDLYARYPALRPKPWQRPIFGQAEPELRDDLELPGEEGETGGGA